MKYLTHSGMNKIVHLNRDLMDVNRCRWTKYCESHIGQLPNWFINYPAAPYPHYSVQGRSHAAHRITQHLIFQIHNLQIWKLEVRKYYSKITRERMAVSSRWIVV